MSGNPNNIDRSEPISFILVIQKHVDIELNTTMYMQLFLGISSN